MTRCRIFTLGGPVTVLGCLAAVTSCTGAAPKELWPVRAHGWPILGGTSDSAPERASVVALTEGPQTGYFCSGTLIAPRWVLTAAHCLEGGTANGIEVFFGDRIDEEGMFVSVARLVRHPGYADTGFLMDDIALIQLDSAAPAEIAPAVHLPLSVGLGPQDEGSWVDFSGYGTTETGPGGERLHVSLPILSVCSGPEVCADFVVPRAFGYIQDGAGPCSGDSGGPAFLSRGGTSFVAGVTAYGDALCQEYGVSTTVSAYDGWIRNYLDSAGSEACDNGSDDDEDGRADCEDVDCQHDPACRGAYACEQPGVVSCGSIINHTTEGAGRHFEAYASRCLPDGLEVGPEVAFLLQEEAETRVRVTLSSPGSADLDLFLLPATATGCDPLDCQEASTNGNANEELVFAVPQGGAYLVVDTWGQVAGDPFTLRVECAQKETCDNGNDDDFDGLVDREDPECTRAPAPPSDDERDPPSKCTQARGGWAVLCWLVWAGACAIRRRADRRKDST